MSAKSPEPGVGFLPKELLKPEESRNWAFIPRDGELETDRIHVELDLDITFYQRNCFFTVVVYL
jgi:hypothetical protein